MKEIDFLPQWYTDDRRRKLSVQRQCISLSIIFLVMILSNALATRSISRASAELAIVEKQRFDAERVVQEYGRLHKQVTATKKVASFSGEVNARPEVANLLGELSVLISEPVVLGHVGFSRASQDPPHSRLSYEPKETNLDQSGPMVAGPLSIRIQGWAPDTRRISALMTALEESPYFTEVYLGYSKEQTLDDSVLSMGPGEKERQRLSSRLEFEIGFVTETPTVFNSDIQE